MLNGWSKGNRLLSRGDYVTGYVLAKGPDFLLTSPAIYLDALVCINDWMGKEMAFPVVMANRVVPL
jgi:hypothetical protein